MATSPTPLDESFESLLAPIPDAVALAGIASSAEFVFDMQEAVRARGEEGPPPDWDRARQLAEEILRIKSKHLQAAGVYVEAIARIDGWTSIPTGVEFLQNLLDRYWDKGLLPARGDDDNAYRAQSIENLGRKLASILREVPLTNRPGGGNLSWNDRHTEAKRERWDGSVARTPLPFYEEFQEELKRLSAALLLLENTMASDRLFGLHGAPDTSSLRDAIRDIGGLIDPIVTEKRKAAQEGQSEAAVEDAQPGPEDSAWASARCLLSEGKAKDAIREMTRLASQEHGRNRFLRKLELAEILIRDLEKVDTKREINKPDQVMLAIVILEDLEEQITKHSLDAWESPQLIGRVLGQLAQLCEKEPIKQTRAAELRLRLRKLDPWQALRWE